MIRFFLITFLFCVTLLQAQKGTLSPYSFYGLGETIFEGTADQRAMGGLTSYSDSIHFNISSPATLADLKLVNYGIGANYSTRDFTSNENTTNNVTASIDYMTVAIPTKHFGFGFGLLPKTAVGYRLNTTDEVNDIPFESNYEGSGGINQVFFSLGFSPINNWGVGAAIYYNFGTIISVHTRQDEGVDLLSQLVNESETRGIEWNLSSFYKIDMSERLQVQLHYSYQPNANLTSLNSRSISTFSSLGAQRDFQELNLEPSGLDKTETVVPSRHSFGAGIGEEKKWYFGGQWTENDGPIKNTFYATGKVNYIAASKLSVGGFFIPEYDSFSNYWKRIVYRFGYNSSTTGMVLNDETIKNNGITFGVGLPVAGYSNLNIGIEAGKLGTQGSSLIEENYLNIRVGFSLNDRWFLKRKYN